MRTYLQAKRVALDLFLLYLVSQKSDIDRSASQDSAERRSVLLRWARECSTCSLTNRGSHPTLSPRRSSAAQKRNRININNKLDNPILEVAGRLSPATLLICLCLMSCSFLLTAVRMGNRL